MLSLLMLSLLKTESLSLPRRCKKGATPWRHAPTLSCQFLVVLLLSQVSQRKMAQAGRRYTHQDIASVGGWRPNQFWRYTHQHIASVGGLRPNQFSHEVWRPLGLHLLRLQGRTQNQVLHVFSREELHALWYTLTPEETEAMGRLRFAMAKAEMMEENGTAEEDF